MSKKIDILVPQLNKQRFSGGLWCVMQYARGLASAGHDVRIVPMAPSPRPDWVPATAGLHFVVEQSTRRHRVLLALSRLLKSAAGSMLRGKVGEAVSAFMMFSVSLSEEFFHLLPFEQYRAAALSHLRRNARDVDVVIATFFETAAAAAFYPATRKLYFCQHLETLFYKEMVGGELSRIDAELSYRLGLEIVVNSSWLGARIRERGLTAELCCNAINHEFFWPSETHNAAGSEVTLISYGGRHVDWKGFTEMAQAVAIARSQCPDMKINWRVYGDACLPPENSIASYQSLGFLQQDQLGDAYRTADILLSASWYESFPLFPLEAMACGLPVIVTQPGTEDFATHLETAYVVQPKDPQSVAQGIIALVRDQALREKIGRQGMEVSRHFTWEKAVDRMREIVEGVAR